MLRERTAGVEFIDENGGGPGVRLRATQTSAGKTTQIGVSSAAELLSRR